MKRLLFSWSLVLFFPLILFGVEPQVTDLKLLQPEHLSALEATPLSIQLTAPETGAVNWVLVASSEDELVENTMSGQININPGANTYTINVPVEFFRIFNIGEDIELSLTVGDQEFSTESTLVAESASTATSSWAIHFTTPPALIYTLQNVELHFTAVNPKTVAKTVTVKLKFMNNNNKRKLKFSPKTVILQPGQNDVVVPVSFADTIAAALLGDTKARVVLKKNGIVKSKDEALLDYDYYMSSSASPSSGDAPLDVTFCASARGGTSPYRYHWDFGDGGSTDEASSVHTYTDPGTYVASCTVMDAINGTLVEEHTITVGQGSLTLTCDAVAAP